MIFSKKDNITIITQENATIIELAANLDKKYDDLSKDNLIVNLFSVKNLKLNAINDFLLISKKHKAEKHSFVIVSSIIDINETPDELTVVPTLQEAFDIIEMEEIERDLGF